jgi:hypothetical protein
MSVHCDWLSCVLRVGHYFCDCLERRLIHRSSLHCSLYSLARIHGNFLLLGHIHRNCLLPARIHGKCFCLRLSTENFFACAYPWKLFVDSVDMVSAFRTKSVSTNPHVHRTRVSEPLSSHGLFRLWEVMPQYYYTFDWSEEAPNKPSDESMSSAPIINSLLYPRALPPKELVRMLSFALLAPSRDTIRNTLKRVNTPTQFQA